MPDRDVLERIAELEGRPFEGEAFRHTGPHYGPVETEGARIHGGRWNPPESFPTLYLGLDVETTAAEFHRLARRQGTAPENLLPRHLHRYRLRVASTLDVTSDAALRRSGLTPADISADDPSRCQAVGDAAHYLGFEAVLAPSATGSGEVLAVFLDRLVPGSLVEPLDFIVWTQPPR